jgi:hypothetical protein
MPRRRIYHPAVPSPSEPADRRLAVQFLRPTAAGS